MTISVVSLAADQVSDPIWLDQLGQVANWKHTRTFPGGPTSATFDFIADPDLRHRALRGGRWVIAYSGCPRVFSGRLEQPIPGAPWSCTVTGVAALGAGIMARSSVGNIYNLNGTIDNAISDGLQWNRTTSLSNPAGSTGTFSGTVDDALAALITQGQYWHVSNFGNITTSTAPAGVNYLLAAINPPSRVLDGYFTRVAISYQDASSVQHDIFRFADASLTAKYGTIDYYQDLTNLGALTATQANTIGDALLARMALNGLPWSNGFDVAPGQMFTLAGAAICDLATVSSRTSVRVIELTPDGETSTTSDLPVGQLDYDDASGHLTVTPLIASQDSLVATIARAHRIKLKF